MSTAPAQVETFVPDLDAKVESRGPSRRNQIAVPASIAPKAKSRRLASAPMPTARRKRFYL